MTRSIVLQDRAKGVVLLYTCHPRQIIHMVIRLHPVPVIDRQFIVWICDVVLSNETMDSFGMRFPIITAQPDHRISIDVRVWFQVDVPLLTIHTPIIVDEVIRVIGDLHSTLTR